MSFRRFVICQDIIFFLNMFVFQSLEIKVSCVQLCLQIAAILLATGGAVLSLMNFENSFSNRHQRVGLALYGFMWLQPIIGFFRPERGGKARSLWYFVHWLFGIAICATGITNVYVGLRTYHERTAKGVRLWTGLLTLEVCFLAFFYLMIDRWSYMMKQGQLPVEQLRQIDNRRTYPTTLRKELGMVQE
ncbi:hypothetical protein PR202_ga10212 [Eleusine coracana subsp. coracana]|uniref:Cytochrome b561 domain-containing protein n=1 Tax=Eleusine coracana subsp. coracana TaxID=191504 RepID=A0AAV5C658_ELECO|nr:hypothetical protein PR202_ga10212 [Eleusine coracana subsp. coracana]